jgi:uncharacterized protein YegP (UPF0339 family)
MEKKMGYLGKRTSAPKVKYLLEVWQGIDLQWYWHISSVSNKQVLAHSEGYTRKQSALNVAKRLHSNMLNCRLSVIELV